MKLRVTMANTAYKSTSGETLSVTFDVGGRTFKVSRSLIKQHDTSMLARLVSDTWQSVKDSDMVPSLFVDRDGDRFAYVLDFLRYGHVKLPYNISKDLLILDLDFFGIEGATDETITVGHDYYCHVSKVSEMYRMKAKLLAQVQEIEVQIQEIDYTLATITLSSRYFEKCAELGSLSFTCSVREGIDDKGEMSKLRKQLNKKTTKAFIMVNECLKEYGLELVSFVRSLDWRIDKIQLGVVVPVCSNSTQKVV